MKSCNALFVNGYRRYVTQGLVVFSVVAILLLPGTLGAQTAGVDPHAAKQLKVVLDYLDNLDRFSVKTHNTIEDVLDFGQKVQFDFDATLTLQRPDKLLAERHGDIVNQVWYFDGKTLTLHDTLSEFYAVSKVPGDINGMLDHARGSLGLIAPASDLLYKGVFQLMLQDVYLATNVGQASISGTVCNHYAFSRPDVDFQIWIPAEGPPLPCKYAVTDKLAYGQPTTTVLMSAWKTAPNINASTFQFNPPEGVTKTKFMKLDSNGTFTH